jgi:hypothetical protein
MLSVKNAESNTYVHEKILLTGQRAYMQGARMPVAPKPLSTT